MRAAAGGRAWVALAAVLAAGAVVAALLPPGPDPAALGQPGAWQRAALAQEPWRLWSAAFLHLSSWHLAANLLGCALVGALGWAGRLPAAAALAWLAAWPATHLLLLARADLTAYVGLSGVLHAGVACAGVVLLVGEGAGARRGAAERRWIGAALLLVLGLKIGFEAPWGPTLRAAAPLLQGTAAPLPVVPWAHAAGAACGAAAALGGVAVAAALRRARPGRLGTMP